MRQMLGVFESRVIALNSLNKDLRAKGKEPLNVNDSFSLLNNGQTKGSDINYYFDVRDLNVFGE